MMTVVRAFDLQQDVLARGRPSKSHRIHRRLGPRIGEANLFDSEPSLDLLGKHDAALRRRGKVRPRCRRSLDCGAHCWVRVAHEHRTEAVVVVDVGGPIDVRYSTPPSFPQIDRVGISDLKGGGDAEGHRPLSTLVQSAGPRRALRVGSYLLLVNLLRSGVY